MILPVFLLWMFLFRFPGGQLWPLPLWKKKMNTPRLLDSWTEAKARPWVSYQPSLLRGFLPGRWSHLSCCPCTHSLHDPEHNSESDCAASFTFVEWTQQNNIAYCCFVLWEHSAVMCAKHLEPRYLGSMWVSSLNMTAGQFQLQTSCSWGIWGKEIPTAWLIWRTKDIHRDFIPLFLRPVMPGSGNASLPEVGDPSVKCKSGNMSRVILGKETHGITGKAKCLNKCPAFPNYPHSRRHLYKYPLECCHLVSPFPSKTLISSLPKGPVWNTTWTWRQ